MWSPSVETATQVSRWFDIDCSAQTSTILLCLILTDLDIMWFIAWRAICTHALGHPRARTRTWMYDPTGPLVGVYNVFSRSKHCTVDVLGGGFCNSSRFDHPLETLRSFSERDKPTHPLSRPDGWGPPATEGPGCWKTWLLLEKKVMLSCCQTSREELYSKSYCWYLLHSCGTKTNRCRNKSCSGNKGENIND